MIKNKHISKITMLTALFIGGIVNAQEFYTCVPKKSWYNNGNNFPNVNELAEAIAKGIKDASKKSWKKIIDLQITSPLKDFKGYLQPGEYRVTAAGAGGEEVIKKFTITKTSEFKACVGAGGGGGDFSGGGGGRGYEGYYGCGYSNDEGNNGIGGRYYGYGSCGYGGGGGGGGGGGSGGSGGSSGIGGSGGSGGYGCYGGGIGDHGGGGGGGGSYFAVADVELILKGGNGKPSYSIIYGVYNGGDGAGPDGYVIIEKME